jgi:hypothetical protein
MTQEAKYPIHKPDNNGVVKIPGVKRAMSPNGSKSYRCPFAWSAWHGGKGYYIDYQCELGINHLKQHTGPSTGDEKGLYRQTYGTVPKSRVKRRA